VWDRQISCLVKGPDLETDPPREGYFTSFGEESPRPRKETREGKELEAPFAVNKTPVVIEPGKGLVQGGVNEGLHQVIVVHRQNKLRIALEI